MVSTSRWAKKLPFLISDRMFNEGSRSIGSLLLIIAGIALIAWDGLAAWERPCRFLSDQVLSGSSCPSLLANLIPAIVALGFLAVSLLAWFNRQKSSISIFFSLISGILSAGSLSAMGSDWGGRIFFLFLSWLAPYMSRFYMILAESELDRLDRLLILSLYGLAFIWSLPVIFYGPIYLKAHGFLRFLDFGVRGTLVLSVFIAIYLAFRKYQGTIAPRIRRQLRLVIFGTVLGIPPLFQLSLLPNTLHWPYFIPYEVTFPFLLLGPIFFLYSIHRSRLVSIEKFIRQTVSCYLLLVLLASLWLYMTNLFGEWTGFIPQENHAWIWIVVMIVFSLSSVPAWHAFNRLAYWVLYGNRNRYAGWLERIAVSLSTVLDRKEFCRVIYNELSALLPVSGIAILMKNGTGQFCVEDSRGMDCEIISRLVLSQEGVLARYLVMTKGLLETTNLQKNLKRKGVTLKQEEISLILPKEIMFLLPLVSENKLQGLILLGQCQPDNYLTIEDRCLVQSFIFQWGIALNKLYLDQEVLQRQQELDRAYRSVLLAREEERKRLARELHDQVIQSLAAHNFSLSALKQKMDGNIRDQISPLQLEVRGVIQSLRHLCAELRPPVLDNLGLMGAIQSLIDAFKSEAYTQIQFNLEGDQKGDLPDIVELCAYRVLQEALTNVQKHAKARQVEVLLRVTSSELDLIVEDDGQGFILPANFDHFTQCNHFGLAGLIERAELVGGTLEIYSVPGHGCQIFLQIPLDSNGRKSNMNPGGEPCPSKS